jgi:cyclic pyranopterin phosphate synthase
MKKRSAEQKTETPSTSDGLSHIDRSGAVQMVDVGQKPMSNRRAVAEGEVLLSEAGFAAVARAELKKGDVFAVSRIAGILGAKRTAELIPLCHNVSLDSIEIEIFPDEATSSLRIRAKTASTSQTGVEMEALSAVAITALTIYDMCKAVDRQAEIRFIRLLEKEGGRSGSFRRRSDHDPAPPQSSKPQ